MRRTVETCPKTRKKTGAISRPFSFSIKKKRRGYFFLGGFFCIKTKKLPKLFL